MSSSFPIDFSQISSANLLQAAMPIPMPQQFPHHDLAQQIDQSSGQMLMAIGNGVEGDPQPPLASTMVMPNFGQIGTSTAFLLADGEVPIQSMPNPHFNEIIPSNSMPIGMPPNVGENIPSKIQAIIKERKQQQMPSKGISSGIKNRKKLPMPRNSTKHHHLRAKMKPYSSVERRNARERNRVHTVNQAFHILKRMIPSLSKNTKRVSKLKILRACIQYVYELLDMMEEENGIYAKKSMQWKFGYP